MPEVISNKKQLKVISNPNDNSFYSGILPNGCQHCVKGGKLVIFITGLCPQRCFYCPVSEEKFAKDRIFADEWEIEDNEQGDQNLIKEAELIDATGAGITGGDPLTVVDRVCRYIKLLKDRFGQQFHTHLYTPMKLVTEETLKKIFDAGLDEIRFHPDLDDDSMWERIKIATKFDWDIGLEIPCLPDKEKQTKKMIDYAKDFITFINLNELEFSDTAVSHYDLSNKSRNYKTKNDTSYGVEGSAELAREIITYCNEKNYALTVYFCPSRLKDRTQMGNRLKRRAKNVARSTDEITDEGTLIRGVIYLPELKPDFSYKKRVKEIKDNGEKSEDIINKLKNVLEEVKLTFKKNAIFLDETKFRLITNKSFVKKNQQKLKIMNLMPAIVEEYPTADSLELEIDFL
jgi:pyruvate formate-lyase activating enzyme-like uncharacterized protein